MNLAPDQTNKERAKQLREKAINIVKNAQQEAQYADRGYRNEINRAMAEASKLQKEANELDPPKSIDKPKQSPSPAPEPTACHSKTLWQRNQRLEAQEKETKPLSDEQLSLRSGFSSLSARERNDYVYRGRASKRRAR